MKELLQEIAEAVSAALGSAERSRWGERVGMGADGTPTEYIDRIAEEAVFEVLEGNGNPLNVLSEEHEYVDNGAEQTLVLDPIDGTFNAIHGIPFFGTSLAVGREKTSDVQYALVKDLAAGTVFYAEKGKGAFADGRRMRCRKLPDESLFSVYIGRLAHDDAYRIAKLGKKSRNFGAASLEMCLVAQGSLDLYYVRTKPAPRLRVADIAAGALILKEAGGAVLNPDGSPLDMPFDIKKRTDLLAVGDIRVLEVIRRR